MPLHGACILQHGASMSLHRSCMSLHGTGMPRHGACIPLHVIASKHACRCKYLAYHYMEHAKHCMRIYTTAWRMHTNAWRMHTNAWNMYPTAGKTKGGSIIVPLTSCLTGLESAVCQLTIFIFICKTD